MAAIFNDVSEFGHRIAEAFMATGVRDATIYLMERDYFRLLDAVERIPMRTNVHVNNERKMADSVTLYGVVYKRKYKP